MQFTRKLLPLLLAILPTACTTTGSQLPAATPLPYKLSSATHSKYRQAVALVRTGKYRQAESALTTIINEKPGLAGPYANLAIVYYHQDRLEKAQHMISTAVIKNPGNPEYHNLKGIISRQQGKFDVARESYLDAIALQPDRPDYHLNLGILYDLYLHEHRKALAEYKKYQQLNKKEDRKVAGWIIDLDRRLQ